MRVKNFNSIRAIPWSGMVLLTLSPSATAQVLPDATLPNNSSVAVDGNTYVIDGGTVRGGNLFHSFQGFSVPTGAGAYFNNGLSITNILGRVTGGSASTIDGLLRTNGTANLFLINPNGISFGSNAALDLGGSFIATTAERLLLGDGSGFSAFASNTAPLLSSAVPVGLGFANPQSGGITVLGTGHQLRYANPRSAVNSPIAGGGESLKGLRTQPGKTLALIGGPVNLTGGVLTAPSGRLEIGSVSGGTVAITPATLGFSFDYAAATQLQDIQLSARSLLDASDNGQVNIFGRNLSLDNGSVVFISNSGAQPPGAITVNIAESASLRGGSDPRTILSNLFAGQIAYSGFLSQNLGTSEGPSIFVSANNLTLQDFSVIQTYNFGPARGGDIRVELDNKLNIIGTPPVPGLLVPSLLGTFTTAGSPGNVELSGRSLSLQDGGLVISQALGTGGGGDITANFSEDMEIAGGFLIDPATDSFVYSVLGTTTTFVGKGGNVFVNTGRLSLRDGGRMNATTTASGPAGSIRVNARKAIEVLGRNPLSTSNNPANSSQIVSATEIPNAFLSDQFDTARRPTGQTGNIFLVTPILTVADKGLVSSVNEGIGPGGTIKANTDLTFLRNGAITAESFFGPGGNIQLDTGVLVGLDNSRISAAAAEDRGGNITINALGFFFSPDIVITATGGNPQLDGTVEINTPNQDLARSSQPVPQPEAPEVVLACSPESGSSQLVNTNAGGIPPNPTIALSRLRGWHDEAVSREAVSVPPSRPNPKFQEAQGLRINPDGTMSLIVLSENPIPYGSLAKPSCS